MLLEICANSLTSALNAEKGGANRIELCENILMGGTTPSAGTLTLCKKQLSIPICALIRPRGGDFLYNDDEFEVIQEDIFFCKKLGIKGVVIGILKEDGRVDVEKMKELAKIGMGLDLVFHRAFDRTPNLFEAMETIISLGFKRILTSGGSEDAFKGRKILADLIKKANNKIEILVGGGVNEQNIAKIIQQTKATQIHLTARVSSQSKMIYKNDKVKFSSNKPIPEYTLDYSDVDRIKKFKEITH